MILFHFYSSMNHFHTFLCTPWVRIPMLSALWSQWKSVISLAGYKCWKKLYFFSWWLRTKKNRWLGEEFGGCRINSCQQDSIIYSVNWSSLMTPNIDKNHVSGCLSTLCDDWKKTDLTWAEWYLFIIEKRSIFFKQNKMFSSSCYWLWWKILFFTFKQNNVINNLKSV